MEPLVDSWGREICSLLVSVTDKVNCVAMRGFTEEEVPALADLARRKPYVVRFIEFMPLDADESWRGDDVLTGGEIRAAIEERWPLVEIPAKASSTARRFRFADGPGEIGFVNPVSEPFCSSCDRMRLTAHAEGALDKPPGIARRFSRRRRQAAPQHRPAADPPVRIAHVP